MLLRLSARNTSFLRCPSSHKRFVVHRLQTYVEIEHEAAFSDPARSLTYHGFVFNLIGRRLESKSQRPVSERAFILKSTTNSGRSESVTPGDAGSDAPTISNTFFASASRQRDQFLKISRCFRWSPPSAGAMISGYILSSGIPREDMRCTTWSSVERIMQYIVYV